MSQGQGGGPKPKYRAAYVDKVKQLSKLGATEREMAHFLDVDEATFRRWKHEHPKLCAAVKLGKGPPNRRTEMSLFHRANGYSHDAEEIVPYDHKEIEYEADGKTVKKVIFEKRILRVPIVKHYPPDTTAGIFFLRNRERQKWQNFKAVEISTPPGKPLQTEVHHTGEPELIGAYYKRLEAYEATACANPRPDPGVGEDGPGDDEQGGDQGFSEE